MPKEVSRAKKLARESVAHYWVTDGMTEEQLAEYAVNLTLEAACKADCTHCLQEIPAYFDSISRTWRHRDEGGDYSCRAAAIRAMMEGK